MILTFAKMYSVLYLHLPLKVSLSLFKWHHFLFLNKGCG